MNRRDFLLSSLAAGTMLAGKVETSSTGSKLYGSHSDAAGNTGRRFRWNYAPHFGMFRHHGGDDPLDQIRFMANEGFVALEDNGLKARPVDMQRQLARELDRHGMQMGVFVGAADFGRPMFASGRRDLREKVLADMRAAVETARRTNARWCSVVPGKLDPGLPMRQQMANAIETLKCCVDVCEPAGLTMLIEPLHHGRAHPRLFLHSTAQAQEICRAVGSPHCKILFDVCHEQAFDRGVVAQLERFWPQIGYIQIGDNSGRKEPGTGDIDFGRIFSMLHAKGYNGIVGMEHGNALPGRNGERAVIDAYVRLDRR